MCFGFDVRQKHVDCREGRLNVGQKQNFFEIQIRTFASDGRSGRTKKRDERKYQG